MESRAAESRARFWELALEVMLVLDREGRIVVANPAASRLWERPDGALAGAPLASLVHPDDKERTARALFDLGAGHAAKAFETRCPGKDGASRTLSWAMVADAGFTHCVGRDVTGQAFADDALRRHRALDTVAQLTAGAGHAFNNMLQGITGSLELVQKRIRQRRFDEAERFVARAQATALRAASLTSRLLDFSPPAESVPQPVEIGSAVLAIDAALRETLGAGIELTTRFEPGLWPMRLDVEELQGAVLRLALNAREAMPSGGRFVIEAGNIEGASADRGHPEQAAGGPCVSLTFRDTGTGMPAASVARAFEPFFTSKPVGEGSGLGLALVDAFVRRAGGEATISSEPGAGTTVRLLLPRFDAETAAHAQAGAASAIEAEAAETVLVIEDEENIRALVVDVLDEIGCRVLEAADGPSGLECLKLNSRSIRLLITDVGLPGLTGHQVADAARLFRPDLKILFMTGYANDSRASQGISALTSTIAKPFALDALSLKVQEMIRWP